MTATSLVPQAAAVAGISFSQLLDRLIEHARGRELTCAHGAIAVVQS
jgi:hypothetical protein